MLFILTIFELEVKQQAIFDSEAEYFYIKTVILSKINLSILS